LHGIVTAKARQNIPDVGSGRDIGTISAGEIFETGVDIRAELTGPATPATLMIISAAVALANRSAGNGVAGGLGLVQHPRLCATT
jgi:hypothetical protein